MAFPQVHLVAHASATGFKLHFLAAMLAYSLLTLSALHAIFMGFTENALHRRTMKRSLASLPHSKLGLGLSLFIAQHPPRPAMSRAPDQQASHWPVPLSRAPPRLSA